MDKHTATELAYNNGYAKGYADGTPKWIPVSERLPEVYTTVLGYYEHGRNIFWYDNNGFNDVDEFGYTYPVNTVTHWMLLPEQPKGD